MSAGRFTVSTAAPRRCGTIFPGRPRCSPSASRGRRFPQDEFAKVQQLALGEIAQPRRRSAGRRSANSSADDLPADSPYHVVPGGKAETVRRLTAEDLQRYHAKYFVPEQHGRHRLRRHRSRRSPGTGGEALRRAQAGRRFPADRLRPRQRHCQDDRPPQADRQGHRRWCCSAIRPRASSTSRTTRP